MSIGIASCAEPIFGIQRPTPNVDVGLRIVWGGNEPNDYVGEISHDNSPLRLIQELSLDHSGTVRKSDQSNRLLIKDLRTRFGGCDVSITGKLDSVIRLQFQPESSQDSPLTDNLEPLETQFTLQDILNGPKELSLGTKSRVVVDRTPGDTLRISNVRSNWVFAPGEALPIQVTPNFTNAQNLHGTLDWELFADGESEPIEQGSAPISLNEYGSSAAVSLGAIQAPRQSGVYEIKIQIRPRRSFTQVFPASIAERRIQFVVANSEINSVSLAADSDRPKDAVLDWGQSSVGKQSLYSRSIPVSLRPWGRVANNLKKLGLSKEDSELRSIDLGPCESFTLPIDELQAQEPYLLSFSTESTMDGLEISISEIVGSGDETQLRPLSFSKIQPTLGKLLDASSKTGSESYSFRFATSGSRAVVRLTSLRTHGAIKLGQINVRKTEGHEDDSEQPSGNNVLQDNAPKLIEHLDTDQWRILLTKGRYLQGKSRYDTWGTLTQSVEEWLRLCKARGANCVAIPVLSSGSCLYPTDRLVSNPLLNTGVFDSAARDPSSKDIVHWLYILCDKYDLEFIPVFEWNSSLHAFKNLPIKPDMWGTLEGESTGDGSKWNPYHAEIQAEMKAILKEFEKRYSKLKGYRGYAIHFGRSSHLALADSLDQISDPIVNQLLSDHFGRIPNEIRERRIALAQLTGNAIYLKHQQAMLSMLQEWECDLNYVFTDVQPSAVDLSPSKIAVVYIHAPGPNLGPWIARRWWLEGFRPIAYRTDIEATQLGHGSLVSLHANWLVNASPVESQALQQRIDRVRVWGSQDGTRAAILNANPWESQVRLQWSVIPQNLKMDRSDCTLLEVEQSHTGRIMTIPANTLVVLSWDNRNAMLHTWGTDESASLQAYQAALQRVESAVNLYSIPTPRNDLLMNADFDQAVESSKGDLIPGWGNSINPNARVSVQSDKPHSSPNHLRVSCDKSGAAAWLQSPTFPLQSNRLQITMHYRVQPGNQMNLQWTLFIWNENSSRFEVVTRRSASVDFSKRSDQWGKWTEDFSDDLAGLDMNQSHAFRLQLDMQGDCTLDIDSVSIATDYLLERERIDFRNNLFLARRSLNEGSSEAVYRLLDSTLVRTLLLWVKDADIAGTASTSDTPLTTNEKPATGPNRTIKPPETEKRSADRRWKLWNR